MLDSDPRWRRARRRPVRRRAARGLRPRRGRRRSRTVPALPGHPRRLPIGDVCARAIGVIASDGSGRPRLVAPSRTGRRSPTLPPRCAGSRAASGSGSSPTATTTCSRPRIDRLGVDLRLDRDRAVASGATSRIQRNFEAAFATIGLPRERILHVAQSLFHDHVPAKALGLSTVWIDRRHDRAGFWRDTAGERHARRVVPGHGVVRRRGDRQVTEAQA